jgi:hypothetical protein
MVSRIFNKDQVLRLAIGFGSIAAYRYWYEKYPLSAAAKAAIDGKNARHGLMALGTGKTVVSKPVKTTVLERLSSLKAQLEDLEVRKYSLKQVLEREHMTAAAEEVIRKEIRAVAAEIENVKDIIAELQKSGFDLGGFIY